jgi:hypothetical protein
MSNEQIYLYRRKGLSDYATCDRARYVELSQHKLFETMVCYTAANHCEDALHMVGPVVERQPVEIELGSPPAVHMAWLLDKVVNPGDYPQKVLHEQIRSTLDVVGKHTAPPELAELQATIERLRDELGECKGEYDRAVNKVDALRERLAERDALLQMFIDNSDDGDVVELSRHALSANATPACKYCGWPHISDDESCDAATARERGKP